MKRIILFTIGLSAILLAGCVVISVYPYYTTKDVTFDVSLLGTWIDADKTNADNESWVFEKIDAQTYKLVVNEKDKKTEFDAHLFKLKEHLFLDCLPRERHEYTAATHVLLCLDSLKPQLEMRFLNYDWLGKLIEKNPKSIRHVVVPKQAGDSSDGGELVLTAETVDLQKFILKHLSNTNAWGDPMVMKKQ